MWKVGSVQEELSILLLVCILWFEMVYDACMRIYIPYVWYSVLWVITLFVGVSTILLHVSNVVLNSGLVSQSKSDFHIILNVLKLWIILEYKKSHVLQNDTSATT